MEKGKVCYNKFMKIISNGPKETQKIATRIAEHLKPSSLILLTGDLGAGKTTFTQSLGKALGITRIINSPTFNIFKIYDEGRIPLYHIDAYRLEGAKQDLGFDEYIDGDGVCVIEWPNYIQYLLPNEYLKLDISWVDENTREINIDFVGDKYQQFKEVL